MVYSESCSSGPSQARGLAGGSSVHVRSSEPLMCTWPVSTEDFPQGGARLGALRQLCLQRARGSEEHSYTTRQTLSQEKLEGPTARGRSYTQKQLLVMTLF